MARKMLIKASAAVMAAALAAAPVAAATASTSGSSSNVALGQGVSGGASRSYSSSRAGTSSTNVGNSSYGLKTGVGIASDGSSSSDTRSTGAGNSSSGSGGVNASGSTSTPPSGWRLSDIPSAAPTATKPKAEVSGRTVRVSFSQTADAAFSVGFDLQFSEDANFRKGVSTFKLRAVDSGKTSYSTLSGTANKERYGTFHSSANGAVVDTSITVDASNGGNWSGASEGYDEGKVPISQDGSAAPAYERKNSISYALYGTAAATYYTAAEFSKKGRFSSATAVGSGSSDGKTRKADFSFSGRLRKKISSKKNLYVRARLVTEKQTYAIGKPASYAVGAWSKTTKATKAASEKTFAVDETEISVLKGKKKKISAAARVDGEQAELKFSSSNPAVAKVSASGVVTGVKPGRAKISISAKGFSKKTVNVQVAASKKDVKMTALQIVPKGSIRLTDAEGGSSDSFSKPGSVLAHVTKGNSYSFMAVAAPKNVGVKKVTWSSTNAKVAKVSAKGVVRIVGTGSATIVAKAADGSKLVAKYRLKADAKKKKGTYYIAPDSDKEFGGRNASACPTNAYGVRTDGFGRYESSVPAVAAA